MTPVESRIAKLLLVSTVLAAPANSAAAQAAQSAAESAEQRIPAAGYGDLNKCRTLAPQIGLAASEAQRIDGLNADQIDKLKEIASLGNLISRMARSDDYRLYQACLRIDRSLLDDPDLAKKALESSSNPTVKGIVTANQGGLQGQSFVVLSGNPPFVHTISVPTVFVIGYQFEGGGGRDRHSLQLSTNLVGSAVASLTGALGANDQFKTFIEKNLAVSFGIPFRSGNAVESSYSLGLGSFETKGVTIWPAFGMQQLDTIASIVPDAARLTKPDQGTWSMPYFGVGATWKTREQMQNDYQDGKLRAVFSIGILLPYYYPGNPASALGAIFSGAGESFVGASNPSLVLNISFPLRRNDYSPPK